jgi:IS30 family transposase
MSRRGSGKEIAQHVQFSVDTRVRVFFCDPNSPWQRGTKNHGSAVVESNRHNANDRIRTQDPPSPL